MSGDCLGDLEGDEELEVDPIGIGHSTGDRQLGHILGLSDRIVAGVLI
jgi:hypothetical protein